jgi:UDP-glucose 4-epimerase
MNILVTGGAGYIGSVTAAELITHGHSVVVYDNLVKGHAAAVPRAAQLVVGDIADRKQLELTFGTYRIDAVVHFAALIEAGESMKAPELYFRNNTAGTLTLLEAMLANGVRRLVFSSTAAVYGEPQRTPILETDRLRPTNAYGESKLMVEQMLEWFHRIHGLRYAALRYFNAAGATSGLGESHEPESHLIPIVLRTALGKRPAVSIYGSDYATRDGTCVRDYIHVVDLARAHILALAALAQRTQLIYNLGNGQGFSVREVIEVASQVTGANIPVVQAARRAGDPAELVASSSKIRQELDWVPRYPQLEAIILSAWNWHQRHPDGYGALQNDAAAYAT